MQRVGRALAGAGHEGRRTMSADKPIGCCTGRKFCRTRRARPAAKSITFSAKRKSADAPWRLQSSVRAGYRKPERLPQIDAYFPRRMPQRILRRYAAALRRKTAISPQAADPKRSAACVHRSSKRARAFCSCLFRLCPVCSFSTGFDRHHSLSTPRRISTAWRSSAFSR